ncbi:MAG: serine/threonine-protein kinase [Gammaproteobacteria bacterium]
MTMIQGALVNGMAARGAMRIIIISDSRDFMSRLRRMLAAIDPRAEVTEYDADMHGRPGPEFDWSVYDLLVIEDRLASAESGLAWLAMFALSVRLPATIMVAAHADPFIASRVGEMQRTEYVLREELDEARLRALMVRLDVEARAQAARPVGELAFTGDSAIVDKLAAGSGDAGSYRFVRLIGQGAQSRVYLAERLVDDLTLVLKVLDLAAVDDPHAVERFAREAQLLASIDSPHVIRFHDHGFTPTLGYIAVEFFSRGDLKQRVQQGMTTADALLYALHIAYGLEAIHARGIVHRDLKPGNIMFRGDGSIALADFGISKRMGESWGLTGAGAVIGTLSYLSPEQGLGRRVDQRSDLYSLGMLLFEMLAGRKAFIASSPGALLYQHLHADVPLLPDELLRYQRLIAKTLAKDPADRFQSAREFIAALEPLVD